MPAVTVLHERKIIDVDELHSQNPRIANHLKNVKNVTEVLEFKERLNYKEVMTADDVLNNKSGNGANSSPYQSKFKLQFLGWHGTSKTGANALIEQGAQSDYQPSERQLRDNLYGDGIYIAGDKRLAGEYADPVSRFTRQRAKGEVIEVWAVMKTDDKPNPFHLEAAKNRGFLIAREGMYQELFFKKVKVNDAEQS